MKRKKLKRGTFRFSGAVIFFVVIALIIQVAVLAYDYITQKTDNKFLIAVLILIVIVLLSVVCTLADIIRRKYTVEKPVNRILDATDKIAKGDFTVRLDVAREYGKYNGFDAIMDNLNVMAAELSKTETLKTDFISNVSHELKTPLAVIKNYAEGLLDEDLDEQTRKKYVKTLAQAANRLNDLIGNVLKLNKLENQEIQPEKETFNLTASLGETIVGFEEWIESKSLDLECELDDVFVYSSPSLLELVWSNLLSNAIKFTENGGKISVSLQKNGGNAIVKVSDTGCGISPETGARIFEKFYQGDTSRASEGNGLGLALVKKVIDVLGGQISVQSEQGKGSTFTITLKGVVHEGKMA